MTSQSEALAFWLAGSGGVLVCLLLACLVVARRRSPIIVAAGPSYGVLQAVGGSVWIISTFVFNGHIEGYSPRTVSLPTCFFWRCKWSLRLASCCVALHTALSLNRPRLDDVHLWLQCVVCCPSCSVGAPGRAESVLRCHLLS
jgi:hypothetical protein